MSRLAPPYRNGSATPHSGVADVEFLALDDKLRDEMRHLSEVNDELLGRIRAEADITLPVGRRDEPVDELSLLREENAQLRHRLQEAEQLLEQVAAADGGWVERQKEYEALLEEKSEVIRTLHGKIKDMQSAPAAASPQARPMANEDVSDIRAELEEQRRQLRQDEEALMQQMRQMEMAMSRDRAELARQRSEMQRMQADLNHEIEMATRDPVLRDRLLSLQRRQQETLARKGVAASAPARPEPEPAKEDAPVADSPRKSGFFGRLFGK